MKGDSIMWEPFTRTVILHFQEEKDLNIQFIYAMVSLFFFSSLLTLLEYIFSIVSLGQSLSTL